MARLRWEQYQNMKAGMSSGEQSEMDREMRRQLMEKGVNPDQYIPRAGMYKPEIEELEKEMTAKGFDVNAGLHSGPAKGGASDDYRTDEYMANAAMNTKNIGGRIVGPLAGMTDARSREWMKVYGPGGPMHPQSKVKSKLRNAFNDSIAPMGPSDKKFVDFTTPLNSTPNYFGAIEKYRELKKKAKSGGGELSGMSMSRSHGPRTTAEPKSGIELAQSQKGCPQVLAPGPGELGGPGMFDKYVGKPSSRSTMYTKGDVLGGDEQGLRSAYRMMRSLRG